MSTNEMLIKILNKLKQVSVKDKLEDIQKKVSSLEEDLRIVELTLTNLIKMFQTEVKYYDKYDDYKHQLYEYDDMPGAKKTGDDIIRNLKYKKFNINKELDINKNLLKNAIQDKEMIEYIETMV